MVPLVVFFDPDGERRLTVKTLSPPRRGDLITLSQATPVVVVDSVEWLYGTGEGAAVVFVRTRPDDPLR